MKREKLPIGSVVQLKESTARVMVMGYLAVTENNQDTVWDYCGVQFPIGYMRVDEIYCFNHEQIEIICVYGYQDLECDEFLQTLESEVNKKNKK